MANMYLMSIIFCLTLALVQCDDPDCKPATCTATQSCQWTCDKSNNVIVGANRTSCTASDIACGTTTETGGKCKAACVTKAVKPTCTSCTPPKVCKWTCNNTAKAIIPDADLTVCALEDTACGSTRQKGQCKSTCAPATDSPSATVAPTGQTGKNGSIKCGLSPLIMICGALAMLFLRP